MILKDIVSKHLGKQYMGQKPANWVHWGDPKEPKSQYQRFYEQGSKFTEKEAAEIKKSPLWRNMAILQSAMAKTNTHWVPAPRNIGAQERFKKSLRRTSRTNQNSIQRRPSKEHDPNDANQHNQTQLSFPEITDATKASQHRTNTTSGSPWV